MSNLWPEQQGECMVITSAVSRLSQQQQLFLGGLEQPPLALLIHAMRRFQRISMTND